MRNVVLYKLFGESCYCNLEYQHFLYTRAKTCKKSQIITEILFKKTIFIEKSYEIQSSCLLLDAAIFCHI